MIMSSDAIKLGRPLIKISRNINWLLQLVPQHKSKGRLELLSEISQEDFGWWTIAQNGLWLVITMEAAYQMIGCGNRKTFLQVLTLIKVMRDTSDE